MNKDKLYLAPNGPGFFPDHKVASRQHSPETSPSANAILDAAPRPWSSFSNSFVPGQVVQLFSIRQTKRRTDLSANPIAGIESISGMDLSDVRVHANSDKPSRFAALAFAQGNDIHLAPGQEHLLPHEAWHVVQQRQGRVPTTAKLQGAAINDDARLESEADAVSARISRPLEQHSSPATFRTSGPTASATASPMQMTWVWNQPRGKWEWEDDGIGDRTVRPDFAGKSPGQRFPEPVVSTSSSSSVAETHRRTQVQEYLDCLPHMAGENNGGLTGGHLLTSMRKKWGDKLQVVGNESNDEPWECEWSIAGVSGTKKSTMFPANWTEAELMDQLVNSTLIGGTRVLKSGIEVAKRGDTFYPQR